MKLARFMWEVHRTRFLITTMLFLAHTVLNIMILRVIGSFTSQLRDPPIAWWQFLLIVIGAVLAQACAAILVDKMSYKSMSVLRERMLKHVVSAPLAALERVGNSRMMTGFIDDVQRVAGALPISIGVARDLCFVTGIFVYLLWLSPKLMSIVLGVAVLSSVLFYFFRNRGIRRAIAYRSMNDRSFTIFSDILAGIKQIKCGASLAEAAVHEIEARRLDAERLGGAMGRCFIAATQISVLLYFMMFLILTYVRVDQAAGSGVIAVYVVALVIVLGPLLNAAFSVEQVTVASISLGRIDDVIAELGGDKPIVPSTLPSLRQEKSVSIREFELREVCHSHQNGERQEFSFGPISLKVRAGECAFIVGGNGTGKTTLVKLATGLYEPLSGEVIVNDVVIDAGRRSWLRRQFSTVFNDLCLFESLLGSSYDGEVSERGRGLLAELRLDRAIDGSSTILSQASSCSSGERKRIAMLLARLDDRPIYIFDEFASDQDPICKDLFYGHVLDELKGLGKIVIVVTHDERYFDRADHVLVLERGLPAKVRSKEIKMEKEDWFANVKDPVTTEA